MLWAPAVALPLALALGWSGASRIATALAVRDGPAVTGTVIRLDRGASAARLGAPRIGARSAMVTYGFTAPTDLPVTGRAAIPAALFETLETGGPVLLRHAAASPATSDPVGSLTLRHGLAFAALASVLGIAGLAILRTALPRAVSMRRAVRSGPVRGAMVVALQPRYPAQPANPDRRVIWRDPVTGAEGAAQRWRRRDLPEPGETIPIRMDPRTGRGWWEAEL